MPEFSETNLHPPALSVDRAMRQRLNRHGAAVLWFTGLSGAGKSTIANLVDTRLYRLGCRATLLDGDTIRQGLNRDLGFTDADRVENVRRVGEVAKLFVEAGLIALVALISPFRAERELARALLPSGDFIEIFVDTPLAVCRQRDAKGLYRKAELGLIRNFTGIDSPYEPPAMPDIHLRWDDGTADQQADTIIATLHRMGVIESSTDTL